MLISLITCFVRLIEVSWTLDVIKHFLLFPHIQAIQVDTKNKYFRDFMMVSKKLI